MPRVVLPFAWGREDRALVLYQSERAQHAKRKGAPLAVVAILSRERLQLQRQRQLDIEAIVAIISNL